MDSPRQFFAKRMGGANPLLISKDSLPGICCLVHICHRPSARIIFPLQCGIPGKCFSSRASHARHTGHASGSRLTGEVFFENATIVIFLLILWRIDGNCRIFKCDKKHNNQRWSVELFLYQHYVYGVSSNVHRLLYQSLYKRKNWIPFSCFMYVHA